VIGKIQTNRLFRSHCKVSVWTASPASCNNAKQHEQMRNVLGQPLQYGCHSKQHSGVHVLLSETLAVYGSAHCVQQTLARQTYCTVLFLFNCYTSTELYKKRVGVDKHEQTVWLQYGNSCANINNALFLFNKDVLNW